MSLRERDEDENFEKPPWSLTPLRYRLSTESQVCNEMCKKSVLFLVSECHAEMHPESVFHGKSGKSRKKLKFKKWQIGLTSAFAFRMMHVT